VVIMWLFLGILGFLRLGRCCHQMLSAVFLSFWAIPLCHHREPPNHVFHLEGGTGDRKLVCGRPFAPLLCICSSSRTTKHHLCIVERNSPTPVRRWFSLTQEGLGWVIPGGERPGDGINEWRREEFFCHSVFH